MNLSPDVWPNAALSPAKPFNAPVAKVAVSETRILKFGFLTAALALALLQIVANRHALGTDGVSYLDMADRIAHGDWSSLINGHWSPLYPLLLAVGLRLFQPTPWQENALVQAVNFVIFLGSVSAFEFFARQLFRRCPNWTLRICGYALFLWSTLVIISVKLTSPDLLLATCIYLAAGMLLRMGTLQTGQVGWSALFGATLGLGYWAKSPMFLFAFVFLGLLPIAQGNRIEWSGWRETARAFASAVGLFGMLALPLVYLQSVTHGKLSFSEVGKHSYAWYVNQVPNFHWHGKPAGYGTPLHPTPQFSSAPAAYEFAAPIAGTYPLWFDPSYWNAGLRLRFDLRQQVEAIRVNMPIVAKLWLDLPGILLLVAIALCWRKSDGSNWSSLILLLTPALAAFGLYLLVHLEPRFVAPFAVLATLAILTFALSRTTSKPTLELRWLVVLAIVGALVVLARPTARDLLSLMRGRVYPERQVAMGLQQLGLQPGDGVAVTAHAASHGKWARPARLRITAEIDAPTPALFWNLNTAAQEQLLDQFSQRGLRAVIAEAAPKTPIPTGWHPVGDTGYLAYIFQH